MHCEGWGMIALIMCEQTNPWAKRTILSENAFIFLLSFYKFYDRVKQMKNAVENLRPKTLLMQLCELSNDLLASSFLTEGGESSHLTKESNFL